MWLLLAFLFVPLIEIALFIQVGGAIGLWSTLLIVILTAIAGTYLVRSQGRQALAQVRGSFEQLNDPSEPLAHGAMILFSGALLLTPGFFTDAIGFALLIPAVRARVFHFAKSRLKVQSFDTRQARGQARQGSGDVIEGEFSEISEDSPTTPGDSGWTRH